MKPKFVCIVQCIHENNKNKFIFRVNDDVKLDAGNYVLVDTMIGPLRMAKCVTPSFRIGDWQLKEFYGIDVKDLKHVTHVLKPVALAIERDGE